MAVGFASLRPRELPWRSGLAIRSNVRLYGALARESDLDPKLRRRPGGRTHGSLLGTLSPMTTGSDLPDFREHGSNLKQQRLTAAIRPRQTIIDWLEESSRGRDRSTLRVLDVGCGRGATVAWLVENGWDAYGIEVEDSYIRNASSVVEENRVRLVRDDRYPFPDSFFDLVISDQVLEHVADFPILAREISRTSRPGAAGIHIFPPRRIMREPHLLMPLVHWFPKGRARRLAIASAMRLGLGAPYFPTYSFRDRVSIFADYSEKQTFYRRPTEVSEIFSEVGIECDFMRVARQRVRTLSGRATERSGLVGVLARVYSATRLVHLETRVRSSVPRPSLSFD